MIYQQSYIIMLGRGRLPETENKRICVISGLKMWSLSLNNFEWWLLLRELLKQYLTERQNGCLRSGRLREVVVMRKLHDCILACGAVML